MCTYLRLRERIVQRMNIAHSLFLSSNLDRIDRTTEQRRCHSVRAACTYIYGRMRSTPEFLQTHTQPSSQLSDRGIALDLSCSL